MTIFKYNEIEEIIGYEFQDKRILLEAFTHSSYANENAEISYERLEFLGDSILGLVVANYLFDHYKEEDEGFLTKTKAEIVSGQSLSTVMDDMKLIFYVRTSQGAIASEILNSAKVKEDLFESIIGAIYSDSQNYEDVQKFIFRFLGQKITANYLTNKTKDYKSKLLEYLAKNHLTNYNIEIKPLANNVNSGFEAIVYIEGKKYGSGTEKSKKKATQIAAKITLETLNI